MNLQPDLWLFNGLVFAVVVLPGLDMAFVAASALGGGWRGGLAAVAGIVAAGQVHVAAGVSGLAALLQLWPALRPLLLLAGAGYMAWVGWGLLRATPAQEGAASPPARSPRRTFVQAAATCLSNPKAYAFTLAVLPPFVVAPPRPLALQALALAGLVALNQALVYGAVALAVAGARRRLRQSPRATGWSLRAVGLLLIGAAAAVAAGAAGAESAQPAAGVAARTGSPALDASHDFDFLFGRWIGHNRKLRAPLSGSGAAAADWETFETELETVPLPGGAGNADRFGAPAWRPGYVGSTLRVYNPVAGLWCLYSFDSRGNGFDAASAALAPPVVGRFEGDTGVFEGPDVWNGKPIRVRYEWRRLGADRATWRQSFSADGGRTWEMNWTVEHRRVASPGGLQ